MNTIKLRKGGKIVRVIENELAKYISKGYVIVEDKKVDEVQKSVPQKPIISESTPVAKPTRARTQSTTTRKSKK